MSERLSGQCRESLIPRRGSSEQGHAPSAAAQLCSGFARRYSERSRTKCVGITIETRPDYCMKRHLSDMLTYGCTRLEIGVQSVYEDVARDTNR